MTDTRWAKRILKRQAAGETLPEISIRMATEVLAQWPGRTPGDDEDQSDKAAATEGPDRVLDDPGAFEGDSQKWDVDKDTGEIRNVEGDDECPV